MLRPIEDSERCSTILNIYASLFVDYLPENKRYKFYGSQPISMMAESIMHITERRKNDNEFLYNITAKLDGTRMLLLLHATLSFPVFIDRSMNFFETAIPYKYTNSNICLFDGEMYENVFFVFDMIYYNGYLCEYCFETRLRTLQELLDGNRDRFTDDVVSPFTKYTQIFIISKLYLELKGFKDYLTSDLYTFVTNYFSENPVLHNIGLKFPLKFDGLIFTPRFTRYILADNWKFPSNILYKWKPESKETIDFVLEKRNIRQNDSSKRQTKKTIGLVEGFNHRLIAFKTHKDCNKFAIIEHGNDVVIDSSHVYECCYDKKKDTFIIVRERPDKRNTPNTIRTANSVWKLLMGKIDIDSIMLLIFGNDIDTLNNIIPQWQINAFNTKSVLPLECSVINRFNMQNGKKGIFQEFEVRFGSYNGTVFETNVAYKHYNWLLQTLDSMSVCYLSTEYVDVFDNNSIRTTYDANVYSIKKHKQDIKNFKTNDTYGYDFRLTVSTEEYVHNQNQTSLESHITQPSVTLVRYKKRKSYNFSANFQIDMTEVKTNSKSTNCIYEVEIELKQYHQHVNILELNHVVLFLLNNLFGKSEIL